MKDKALISGISLSLFVTAGAVKAAPILANLPGYLDFTIITGAVVVILGLKRTNLFSAARTAELPQPYALLALFCVLMIVSLLYTPDLTAGLDKTMRFLVFSVLAAVAPVFLLKEPAAKRIFLLGLFAIGTIATIAGLINWSAHPADFAGALGANHIALGRLSGMTVLIGLALTFFGLNARARSLGALAAAAAAGALLVSSARGPLLALGIALPSTLLFLRSSGRLTSIKVFLIALALPLATWAIIAVGWLPPIFSRRLLYVFTLFSGGYVADGSVTNRLTLAERGLRSITSSPVFGLGVGGFSSVAWDLPANHYPHNVFIEAAAELGLPALFVLAVFILSAAIRLRRTALQVDSQEERFIAFSAGGLLVFWLINAMLSGDLNDNRLLLATVGLIFAFALRATPNRPDPVKDRQRGGTG